MNMFKQRLSATLVGVGLLLAGCGAATETGRQPGTSTPAPSQRTADSAAACANAAGPLDQPIVAGFGGNVDLWSFREDGAPVAQITAVQSSTALIAPAWSPDGKTLAYTLVLPGPDPARPWVQTGALCAFDRATGQGRVLVAASGSSIPSELSWTPDGAAILASQRRVVQDEVNQLDREEIAVVRYDLATGGEQILLPGFSTPAVAPDGKRLAYVSPNPQTGFPTLMLAAIDGSNPLTLIGSEHLFKGFTTIRWSPDGTRLVFSARGGPTVGEGAAPAQRSWLARLFGAGSAAAHGEPGSLWIVQSDGTGLRPLLPAADDPLSTWAPDGTSLLVSDWSDGLFLLDPATSEQTFLSDKREFWALEWAAK
jgi:Tol biopolymer transport system component